ncbi:MAG: class I SAM-dependent methyltransferase [Xanthomonas sp.]|nr:class I SAM-dependent methyltransferase [Xanthomonas sp.]
MTDFRVNASMGMRPKLLPASAWLGHIPFAAWIMEELRPVTFVELGTHNGASYLAFCQAAIENSLGTRCFAVDTWEGDEHAGLYGEEVYRALWNYHQEHYASFSQLLRMTFDDALLCFDDGSVDLLHIDGLHTYEAVKHDFETWLPKMSSRGVVLFHDILVRERGFGVWRLWDELSSRYPSFEFLHTHGLGVLVIGSEVPRSLAQLVGMPDAESKVVVGRLFTVLGDGIRAMARAHEQAQHISHIDQQKSALESEVDAANVLAGHLRQRIVDAERELGEHNFATAARDAIIGELRKTIEDSRQEVMAASVDQQRQALLVVQERLEQQGVALDSYLTEVRAQFELRVAEVASHGQVERAAIAHRNEEIFDSLMGRLAAIGPRLDLMSSGDGVIVDGLKRIESDVTEMRGKQVMLLADIERQEDELQRMHGSLSWRLTRPLRWLSRNLLGGDRG